VAWRWPRKGGEKTDEGNIHKLWDNMNDGTWIRKTGGGCWKQVFECDGREGKKWTGLDLGNPF